MLSKISESRGYLRGCSYATFGGDITEVDNKRYASMYQDGWIGWSRYVDRRTEGKRKRNEWQSVWVFLKLFLWWATSPLWQVKKFHGKCSLYINSFQQMLCNASTWAPNSLFGSLLLAAFASNSKRPKNLLPSQRWGFAFVSPTSFKSLCKKTKSRMHIKKI